MDWGRLLTFHLECLQGLYFSELLPVPEGRLAFSDVIRDRYYNVFVPTGPLTSTFQTDQSNWWQYEDDFLRRGRLPTAYGRVNADGPRLRTWANEVWLFATTVRNGEQSSGVAVRVIDSADRRQYVRTFERAYSGDAADTYGRLDPAYAACLDASFDRPPPVGFARYDLLAHLGRRPVAVATVFVQRDLAAVYGLGTVPEVRERAVGSVMMAHAADVAWRAGARHVFLQTPAGSSVEYWYRRRGYRRAFVAAYVAFGTGDREEDTSAEDEGPE
jgi:GNAT superfamily N-acetyltransferase